MDRWIDGWTDGLERSKRRRKREINNDSAAGASTVCLQTQPLRLMANSHEFWDLGLVRHFVCFVFLCVVLFLDCDSRLITNDGGVGARQRGEHSQRRCLASLPDSLESPVIHSGPFSGKVLFPSCPSTGNSLALKSRKTMNTSLSPPDPDQIIHPVLLSFHSSMNPFTHPSIHPSIQSIHGCIPNI